MSVRHSRGDDWANLGFPGTYLLTFVPATHLVHEPFLLSFSSFFQFSESQFMTGAPKELSYIPVCTGSSPM